MNYQKIHNQIIDKAKSENRKRISLKSVAYIYYENHHIIPRCLGGSDDKDNLVLLTAREHFLIHWLLCRIYPENIKLACAFYLTSKLHNDKNFSFIPSSRTIEEAKLSFAKASSKIHTGKVLSKETIEKKKKSYKENPFTKETIALIQKNRNFIQHSEESKKQMSNTHLLNPNIWSDIQKNNFKDKTTNYWEERKTKLRNLINDIVDFEDYPIGTILVYQNDNFVKAFISYKEGCEFFNIPLKSIKASRNIYKSFRFERIGNINTFKMAA